MRLRIYLAIIGLCLLQSFTNQAFGQSKKDDLQQKTKAFHSGDDNAAIYLNADTLFTDSPEMQAAGMQPLSFSGSRMQLIQFRGPIQPAWYTIITSSGAQVIDYIPNNAYLIFTTSASLQQIRKQGKEAADALRWDGEYLSSYRFSPNVYTGNANAGVGNRTINDGEFSIQLFANQTYNSETLAILERLQVPGSQIFQQSISHYVNITVTLSSSAVQQIALRPDVISIHRYVTPKKRDEAQNMIMTGQLSGNSPSPGNYLTYLAGKGFNQSQFDASNFVVNVSDDGLDNGSIANVMNPTSHFALFKNGDAAATSRIAFIHKYGTATDNDTRGCDGHGNINAHIIGGYIPDALLTNSFHTDANSFRYGLGIAPFVKVGNSTIFRIGGVYSNPNVSNLEAESYRDGGRISSNSWGAPVAGVYNSAAQAYDFLVRDAQSSTSSVPVAGNQQMVILFAAGNDGSGSRTIGSPGTGKNVITVGASENVRPLGGPDGCGTNDAGADNANDVATFSSRGPTTDGRIKPDIMAPGTHITGGAYQSSISNNTSGSGTAGPCFTGGGVCGGSSTNPFFPFNQQWTTLSTGTSHSTPAVAGFAALVRQDFINRSLTPPSPAMTKAMILNCGSYMNGAGANDNLFSNNQGMGLVNMNNYFTAISNPRILKDEVSADVFTASGQSKTFTGIIADNTKPFRVTLAYTDAPGSTTGNSYVNNLDLEVTVGGNVYRGNFFSGANSFTGGTADIRNNVESIFLPAGVSGPVSIKITATNIAGDGIPNTGTPLDQDYALIVSNINEQPIVVINSTTTTIATESCVADNNAIDPGETVTVNFCLKNIGNINSSSLVATLQNTGGVSNASAAQNYGAVVAGGPDVCRPFTFTANGTCGSTITATFNLQDGAANLGTITYILQLGVPGVNTALAEAFDGVTAPALPSGWTTTATGGEVPWVTSTTNPSSAPNAAFAPDVATVGNTELITPSINIPAVGAQLSFKNLFNMEASATGFDGMVLEISINGGAYTDITSGGNAFVTGGYTRTISTGFASPIAGRQAWSGLSGGTSATPAYITSTINLPAAANGQAIQLKWRAATDNSDVAVGSNGVRIDDILISNTTYTCCTPPATVNYYVDDNSDANDIYTPGATGSDATGTGSATAPYRTITKALSVATTGSTIYVDAGTFQEQVIINQSLNIIGAARSGASTTKILSPAALVSQTSASNPGHHPIVMAKGSGNTINIKQVLIDGNGNGNSVGSGAFHGVYYDEASGTFEDSRITAVRNTPLDGTQTGNAFFANHAYDVSIAQTVTIKNNIIDDYQKTGILINEWNTQGIITGNTITGAGPLNNIAQNGVQLGYGAYGTITGNTIANNNYLDPTNTYEAGGIILFGIGVNNTGAATGNSTTISGNILSGNGAALLAAGDNSFGYSSNKGLTEGPNTYANNAIHVWLEDIGAPGTNPAPNAANVYDKKVDNTFQTNVVYGQIQEAINYASNGHTLNASAGTFIEQIVVDKSLTILGANANVNPCSGVRNAETIILPSSSQPYYDGTTEVRMMQIEASNVVVKGFTFDGNNPALTTNVIDAADGIDMYADDQGIVIENNILKNINEGAINAAPSSATALVENRIINNSFNNIPGNSDPAYPASGYGIGVYLYGNFYTAIDNNCMANVRIGVQVENFYVANTGATTPSISNNAIQSRRVGIWYNNNFAGASTISINDNNITTAVGATTNEGLVITSIQSGVGVNVNNNNVTGANRGISLWNNPTTSTVNINTGTLTNCNVGVFATNYDTRYGNGQTSSYIINQLSIQNPVNSGVHITDDALNTNGASTTLTLRNTFVSGGADGVLVTGLDVAGIINNNSITGSTDKFVDASAYTGIAPINAECNWYGTTNQGIIASKMSGNVDYVPFLTNGTDAQPGTAGFQPVAGSCNGVPLITYYPRELATDLSQESNWTDNESGMGGSSPMNFTSPNQLFNVNDNVANPTVLGAWSISGGSNLLLTHPDSLLFRPTASLTIGSGSAADFNGKSVTLKSTAAGTAFIGQITGSLTGASNVTVERYLSSQNNRAYRLLAPSVNSASNIRANWQEGVNNPNTSTNLNPVPRYGNHITGSSAGLNGFDATQTGQASLFLYEPVSTQWQGISNTNTNLLMARTGYLLFVRGDRSMDLNATSTPLPSSNTTLRSTGTLLTGPQSFSGTTGNNGFNLVTNPYASPINWTSVRSASTGLTNFYTLWDPNVGSRGGYVTVSNTGVNSNGSSNATTDIQSGQAFFVQASGVPAPTVNVMEAHKSTGNNTDVFRLGSQTEMFRSSLFYTNASGTRVNADGVTSVYNNLFNAAVDEDDATQIANWDEDIAIARSSSLLSIESRPLIDNDDTIPFTVARLQVRNYEWQFAASNFNAPLLTAVLVDNFQGTRTPISMTGTTVIPFSVTGNTASSAPNRFMVVFAQANNLPLPLNLLSARAYQKEKNIQVEWTTGAEATVERYEVEQSADARQFTKAFGVTALGGSSNNHYSWLDLNVHDGANYYRIKAIGKTGEVQYSKVMRVNMGKGSAEITLYPNPVKGAALTVSINLPKGSYTLTLTNKLGQQLYTKNLVHAGGAATQTLHLPPLFAQGVYQLSVSDGNTTYVKQLIKE